MFSKLKLLKMTNDDSINHSVGQGNPFLSPTTPAGAEAPLPSKYKNKSLLYLVVLLLLLEL